jgi:small-conductance mechanosensitive channel
MTILSIIDDFIVYLQSRYDILQIIFIMVFSSIIFLILLKILQHYLFKKVKTKKHISNVKVFLGLIKFVFVFFLIIILISLFYGDLTQLGFVAGLLSVAIGWALQRPISGVVAWFILVVRRPFDIGDRVIISDMKGDVTDITLTHIFLDEVGGTIEGEERSGRTVMIPTSIIFEKEIINYTREDEYILVEIVTAITYESNLQKAEEIIMAAVQKNMEPFYTDFPQRIPKTAHIRLQFRDSGIDVTVRYYTITTKRNQIATNIRRDIFYEIQKAKDVEFAYPHTEVLLKKKDQEPE